MAKITFDALADEGLRVLYNNDFDSERLRESYNTLDAQIKDVFTSALSSTDDGYDFGSLPIKIDCDAKKLSDFCQMLKVVMDSNLDVNHEVTRIMFYITAHGLNKKSIGYLQEIYGYNPALGYLNAISSLNHCLIDTHSSMDIRARHDVDWGGLSVQAGDDQIRHAAVSRYKDHLVEGIMDETDARKEMCVVEKKEFLQKVNSAKENGLDDASVKTYVELADWIVTQDCPYGAYDIAGALENMQDHVSSLSSVPQTTIGIPMATEVTAVITDAKTGVEPIAPPLPTESTGLPVAVVKRVDPAPLSVSQARMTKPSAPPLDEGITHSRPGASAGS